MDASVTRSGQRLSEIPRPVPRQAAATISRLRTDQVWVAIDHAVKAAFKDKSLLKSAKHHQVDVPGSAGVRLVGGWLARYERVFTA